MAEKVDVMKKRPALRQEEEEPKHLKPTKPNDKEVEEFFALIRRIRSTSKLLRKENGRNTSLRWEDFAVSLHNPGVLEPAASCTVSEKSAGSGRGSRQEESPTLLPREEAEDQEAEKRESVQIKNDRRLTGWLDLNVEAPTTDRENLS